MNVPVLWVISGGCPLGILAADPLELGIGVPDDVAALAGCFWRESALVLVTTLTDQAIPVGRCEALTGTVDRLEALAINAALELVT